MTVLLRTSRETAGAAATQWFCVGDTGTAGLDEAGRMGGLGERLERAFESEVATWKTMAAAVRAMPGGPLSHAATCAVSPSDMGVMLAWVRVVADLAREAEAPVLAVCDDPWMFRALAELPGVAAGPPPPLWRDTVRLGARGWVARVRHALRLIGEHLSAGRDAAAKTPAAGRWIIVYGHPGSDGEGRDAYFADCLKTYPSLARLLHTDCLGVTRRRLCRHARTVSLHAWGRLADLPRVALSRWRYRPAGLAPAHDWVVRRAVAREGASAAHAATAWQMACQARFLADAAPKALIWPWENHPWERALLIETARLGVDTVGYCHTIVGRHSPNLNPTPPGHEAARPARVFCNGPAFKRDLVALGLPAGVVTVAGSLRFSEPARLIRDADGPVFVALPSNRRLAEELLAVAVACARALPGRRFLIKDHPMYALTPPPLPASVTMTDAAMHAAGGLSAVLYCASTVGLEAALAGLPVVRFQSARHLAMDILPDGVDTAHADATTVVETLRAAIAGPEAPPPDRSDVFRAPDGALWRSVFAPDPAP